LRPTLGLCGTDQSENEGCLAILHVRLYVKQVEEEDVWLRRMGGREGEYEEGRQPGSLGTTAAVKPRQLQKQKLPSQPQPPTQQKWEGHHSGRGPAPCRLGQRARAGGLIVLGSSRAPPPTSPVR